MTSTDWNHDDTMPSMEGTSDLFAGDILGDELIDIYNAAVVGAGDDDDEMNEIPTLLDQAPEAQNETETKDDSAHPNNPAEPVVTTTEAIGDGLGAFRPSTSFNDLSTLLPASNTAKPVSKPGVAPETSTAGQGKVTDGKKRTPASAQGETPPAKRRATTNRKSSGTGTKSKSAKNGSNSKSTKSGKQTDNTPNPLTTTAQPTAAPAEIKKEVARPVINAPVAVAPSVPVVTPRPCKSEAEVTSPEPDDIPSSTPSAAPTEADFQSVAQAAVSNLIMNAGAASGDDSVNDEDYIPGKIDTSTEHIKALTGSNWVAVCAGGDIGQSVCSATDKMNNRARRQNLTADERARQNRDRNREHARNTRLRKKAYVEELKRTLTALVTQRDATELEKRHAAQRELEQREVRFRVIEEFLKLRGRNEVNFARWAAILEENFTLTIPVTNFREMTPTKKSTRESHEQVLSGVSEAMADSNLFASFIRGLGKAEHADISFVYNCDRKNFFMDNCIAVLDWTASTQGAVHQGAPAELILKGNLKANFSPASNKLISVAMSFDTGMVASQLSNVFAHGRRSNIKSEVDAYVDEAAYEADAILDSLGMPLIDSSVPTNVSVVEESCGAASVTDVEKEDSSDESNADCEDTSTAMSPRRSVRVLKD